MPASLCEARYQYSRNSLTEPLHLSLRSALKLLDALACHHKDVAMRSRVLLRVEEPIGFAIEVGFGEVGDILASGFQSGFDDLKGDREGFLTDWVGTVEGVRGTVGVEVCLKHFI